MVRGKAEVGSGVAVMVVMAMMVVVAMLVVVAMMVVMTEEGMAMVMVVMTEERMAAPACWVALEAGSSTGRCSTCLDCFPSNIHLQTWTDRTTSKTLP